MVSVVKSANGYEDAHVAIPVIPQHIAVDARRAHGSSRLLPKSKAWLLPDTV